MHSRQLLVVVIVSSVMIRTLAAERVPDFSGTWSLVMAPGMGGTAGGGRAGTGGGGVVVSIVSGAPVNCGTECTITQSGKALTISQRASPQGVRHPDVVLNLEGRDSTITQSLNPRSEYKASARWDGDKLVVTRSITDSLAVTQTIFLEDGKLIVISRFNVDMDVPVKFTYARK